MLMLLTLLLLLLLLLLVMTKPQLGRAGFKVIDEGAAAS